MKLVDARAMSEIDRRAQEEFGFPSTLLMENAGIKSYRFLADTLFAGAPARPIVFLVGKGNNGGDAMVICRQAVLDGRRDCSIVFSGKIDAVQSKMCRSLGVIFHEWPSDAARAAIGAAAVIIDGLTGTGVRGALRAPLDTLVAAANAASARRISVDVPSGVSDGYRAGYPAIRADVTLTMGLPKLALYLPTARPLCGDIHVIDIGFPRELQEDAKIPGTMITAALARAMAGQPGMDAYKNRRGTVGIFAGARGTSGAAYLCAQAAARSRAGLVTLFATPDTYALNASRLGAVMVRECDYERETVESAGAASFDVRLVGPGWGTSESREQWLPGLLDAGDGVLDADGINVIAANRSIRRPLQKRWIMTPHPGEFSRLSGVPRDDVLDDPVGYLTKACDEWGAVIVLKSHVTYVGEPGGRFWVLDGVTPALGTGGSGDVLAGVIAGLFATGIDPAAAACAGVFAHNRAGRRAFDELGWFAADDLLSYLPAEARFDA